MGPCRRAWSHMGGGCYECRIRLAHTVLQALAFTFSLPICSTRLLIAHDFCSYCQSQIIHLVLYKILSTFSNPAFMAASVFRDHAIRHCPQRILFATSYFDNVFLSRSQFHPAPHRYFPSTINKVVFADAKPINLQPFTFCLIKPPSLACCLTSTTEQGSGVSTANQRKYDYGNCIRREL